MNIFKLNRVIQELEEIKNPYPYDLELLKFYKKRREELYKTLSKKINLKIK